MAEWDELSRMDWLKKQKSEHPNDRQIMVDGIVYSVSPSDPHFKDSEERLRAHIRWEEKKIFNAIKDEEVRPNARKTFNLDSLALRRANTGFNNIKKWLPKADIKRHPELYSRPITYFDIETGHQREVLALGAVKVAMNKLTGLPELIGIHERYYQPTNTSSKQWRETLNVHGLTPQIISKLRKLQEHQNNLKYPLHYNAQEQIAFRRFFDGSVLAGHNIAEFDIPTALGTDIGDTTVIDTLIAAENLRGRGGNKNIELFKKITGKTMSQYGLQAHNALYDVFANIVTGTNMLKMKNDVGQAMRFVLNNPGYQLAIRNGYLDSMIAKGGYQQWQNDMGFYLSKQELNMNKDFENEGRFNKVNGMDVDGYHEVFTNPQADINDIDLAKEYAGINEAALKAALDKISTSFTNLSYRVEESAAVQMQANAHDAGKIVSYVSKFLPSSNATWAEAMSSPDYLDALTLMGVPEQKWTKVFRQARRLRQIREDGDWDPLMHDLQSTVGRLNHESTLHEDAQGLFDKALDPWTSSGMFARRQISQIQEEWEQLESRGNVTTRAFKDLKKSLDDVSKSSDFWKGSLEGWINNVKPYDFDRWFTAFGSGMGQVSSAAKGIVPSFLMSPFSRITNAVTQNNWARYQPMRTAINTSQAILPSLTAIGSGVGFAVGGPVGALVGGGIASGINGITQIVGNVKEGQINATLYGFASRLNMFGTVIDIATIPIKALTKATKILLGSLTGLTLGIKKIMTSGLKDINRMGTPLTSLTGVDYGQYQSYSALDTYFGFSNGTLNSMTENITRQRELFMTGQGVDTNRLVAASMLGVYDQVYGSDASLNSLVNALVARGPASAQDMALMSKIDPNLASIVQIMQNMGRSSFSGMMNKGSWGMVYDELSEGERNAMRTAGFEYGAVTSGMGNSWKRISMNLWNFVGKDLYNGFADMLRHISKGEWEKAFDAIKKPILNIWNSLTSYLEDKDLWGKFKSNILGIAEDESIWSALRTRIVNPLLNIAETIAHGWISIFAQLLRELSPQIESLFNFINTIRINPMNLITGKGPVIEYGYSDFESKTWENGRATVYGVDEEGNLLKKYNAKTYGGKKASYSAMVEAGMEAFRDSYGAAIVDDEGNLKIFTSIKDWRDYMGSEKSSKYYKDIGTGVIRGIDEGEKFAHESLSRIINAFVDSEGALVNVGKNAWKLGVTIKDEKSGKTKTIEYSPGAMPQMGTMIVGDTLITTGKEAW